jgi:EAL domain-containing protein (putative c-di-GMP-specific phosphodiesterase class I)
LDFFEIESEEEIEGLPWLDLISSDQANEAKSILKSASKEGDGGEATLMMQTTHGQSRLTRMKMVKAFYEGEDCLQVTLRPILEEKTISLPMPSLSSYEQLANRVQEIQKNPDLASTTALVLGSMADRESFETLGFPQIPEFMRQLSERCAEENTYLSECLILDGHVLAILVFNLSPDQGPQWITEFKEKIAAFPIEVDTRSLKPTLALGGIMLGPEWKQLQEDPLIRAEEVWKTAKATRRAEWFDPAARDREADLRKQALLEHIRHSVENNQLSLAYRPILPLTGQQLEIYEVFVRMKALEGNQWLRPEQFLLQAEKNGLGGKVDDWVFQNALSSIQDARRQNRDPRLIISMGTTSLLDPDFPSRIVQMAQRKNVPADRLIIQINEGVARTQQALVERLVQAKEQWHFELAVSRFTGQQESLDLLKWVKPDWVKFDESWTRDLSKNEKQQQKLKLLVAHLHEHQITTIADFVRDSATTTVLFSSQVAHAAGDFLAPEAQVMHVDLA